MEAEKGEQKDICPMSKGGSLWEEVEEFTENEEEMAEVRMFLCNCLGVFQ